MLTPNRGFSLLEALITMAIVGIVLALAVPQYGMWIQNSQIRTLSESIHAGIQFAKLEAIKRNQNVEIVFDADFRAWNINLATNPATLLRREEGLAHLTDIQVTPTGGQTLTFSGLGRLVANLDGSAPFNQLSIDNAAMPQTESQDLVILLTAGGSVKLCNPNKIAPDPRAC